MKNENLFEIATRGKFRFPFRGMISVEDLWDLSVEDLDIVFKKLNSQLKQSKEESLLGEKTQQDKELDVKINIIKYIVSTKLEEAELRAKARDNKAKKQQILEILAKKQNTELENKSIGELKKMLEDLEG